MRTIQVTVGVARGRQENAVNAYKTKLLKRDPPITMHLSDAPVFPNFTVTVRGFDTRTTVRENGKLDRTGLLAAIRELQVQCANGKGHTNNAKTANGAA